MSATFTSRAKRLTFGSASVLGTLALAVSAPLAAQATTVISNGDLDVIEVEASETSSNVWDVELVGHDHDTNQEFDPAAVSYQVTSVGGVGYIGEGESLSAGFSAGDAGFLADLQGDAVTFTLADATRTGSQTGTGVVSIDNGASINLNFDADTYIDDSQNFVLNTHTHPDWEINGKGTYTLVFDVSATPDAGVIVNGLPDSVTVTVQVV